jgi:predicted nuclease with RNAse H fold
MITVGVDLAAEAATTAVAVLEWHVGGAVVTELKVPADDNAVLQLTQGADKIGIDCPLGWPDAFVEFLSAHRERRADTANDVVGADWRRGLANRLTDRRVREQLNMVPLSVATDRIGLTAMRAARLQNLLAARGHPIDRAGAGLIVEVYPAAGLNYWQLDHRRYKGNKQRSRLGELVDRLLAAAPWLALDVHESLCRHSDHAFDAVVAGLLARASAVGLASKPGTDEERDAADTEGWIAVPTAPLADLVR